MQEDSKPNQNPENTAVPTEPTPAQPIIQQQVITEKSLSGLSGWLMFFVICLGIAAFSYLMVFFFSLAALIENPTAQSVINLFLSPIIAAGATGAIVFIALRKKLGKWLAIGTYAAFFVYFAINSIVSLAIVCSKATSYSYIYRSACSASDWVIVIGMIIGQALIAGLMILYFLISKRVKATLTE